ncbi:hypothetical protein Tcan_02165 [Toxocara canis]|uniref:Uncharacterized protein n=1 Tax=Toxocara canis TaxID=6265 RepID=A0A0B2UQT5_TOXCA|nr:hypothetical protein Tcan_02165 [Toxocara canis]
MTTDVPEGICKEEEKPQQSTSLMRGGMVTFPPMAVYLPEAEEPEDPSPVTNALSARSDLVRMPRFYLLAADGFGFAE